ncbi:MAG: hypothetical protein NVS3B25_03190 [Hymenobacter sp.]
MLGSAHTTCTWARGPGALGAAVAGGKGAVAMRQKMGKVKPDNNLPGARSWHKMRGRPRNARRIRLRGGALGRPQWLLLRIPTNGLLRRFVKKWARVAVGPCPASDFMSFIGFYA